MHEDVCIGHKTEVISFQQKIEQKEEEKDINGRYLEFDNYLVGLLENKDTKEYKFMFNDGTVSNELTTSTLYKNLIEPPDAQVRRVELGFNPKGGQFVGCRLTDADGNCLL